MFGLDGPGFILLVFFLALYGLPTLLAGARHHNALAIGALNLLLGWTVLGWIAALVWALTATPGAAPRPLATIRPETPAPAPPPPPAVSIHPDPPLERKVIALVLILALLGLTWYTWADAAPTCSTTYDTVFQRYVTRCSDGRQYQSRYDRGFDRWRTTPMPPWKALEKGKR